jgi:hypothetical protein
LELENTTINLVDEQNGLDLLSEGLTEYSFCLDADAFNIVNDNKSAVCNSEGSSNF